MKLITPVVLGVVGLAISAALVAFTANRPVPTSLARDLTDIDFVRHLAKYGKSYGTVEEYSQRAGIFRDNLEKIRQGNLDPESTFTLGVNHLADWTEEEYRGLLRYQKPLPVLESSSSDMPDAEEVQGPVTMDWRTKNAVTQVKNQGRCKSDWAFSAVGAMESGWKIANGILYTLSEQQLVDCAGPPYFNHGCKGGDTYEAFKYATNKGMMQERSYPYIEKS